LFELGCSENGFRTTKKKTQRNKKNKVTQKEIQMNVDSKVNVNMTGEVVGKDGNFLTVETTAIDKKGNFYGTEHTVKLAKGMKAVKGEFVHIEGHLDMDENGLNFIEPKTFVVYDEAVEPKDCRMNAWVVGEASSNFIEPQSLNSIGVDKRPFGVASVKVGNRFQRAIVFNNLIAVFRKNLKAGAIVRLAGRIQYREYEKQDTGEKRTICEIICDNSYTEILKASTKKNPFAFSNEDGSDGIMAASGIKRATSAV
jgi:hypothetical protein